VAELISDDEREHVVLACVSCSLAEFVTSLPNIEHYYWWYNRGQNSIEMGLCCISGMSSECWQSENLITHHPVCLLCCHIAKDIILKNDVINGSWIDNMQILLDATDRQPCELYIIWYWLEFGEQNDGLCCGCMNGW